MGTRRLLVCRCLALLAAVSTARADQSIPAASKATTRRPPPRRVIRIDGLDRCMGRLVRPLVLTLIAPDETGEAAASLRAGLALAERAQRGDLEAAAKSLERAAGDRALSLHEAALFELARVRYRLDDLDGAAAGFARALDAQTSELRDEALRYLALALGDTCGGGSLARARTFVDAAGAKPWRIDLWRALAGAFFETGEWAAAIEANRALLELAPLDPRAPEAQVAIVRCLQRQRDLPRAAVEQEKLAAYRGGSAWYQANRRDPDALARAAVEAATPRAPVEAAVPPCRDDLLARILAARRAALTDCLAHSRDLTHGRAVRVALSIEVRRDGSIAVDGQADPALACITGVLDQARAPAPDEQCRTPVVFIGG